MIAAGILAAVLIAVLVLHERERKSWADERRELLNRIQHPQYPIALGTPPELEPKEYLDEYERVGSISFDEDGTDAPGLDGR